MKIRVQKELSFKVSLVQVNLYLIMVVGSCLNW